MNTILITAAAGFVATGLMSFALYLIHWRGFANADMINAVGSLVTRNEANALGPGLAIHFGVGIVFAFLYVAGWSLWGLQSLGQYVLLGLLTGAFHGLVVSFLLVAMVAEHHPLPRFQEAGLGVAVAHWVGHVVYGAVIGIAAGQYLLRFDFVPLLAEFP
jgi:uncharacterized membrane protein YagU involved in acid resistance